MPGNALEVLKERESILRRTMFPDEDVFSAQENEGYVVFKPLAPDVENLTVYIPDVAVAFRFQGRSSGGDRHRNAL